MAVRRGLICDTCLSEYINSDGMVLYKTGALAMDAAKRDGWRVSVNGKHVCAECQD